ncbi:MAG: histidine kinase [Anaerolineae bacterium]|nr:histidine kinase [Anaerolineae bacterium]MDW8172427.1 histidine kinase [Anaerolineae bacterium]
MLDFHREREESSNDPRQALIEMITQEMNIIRRRLNELRDQVTALQGAVDREQNKYASIATDLRNIKDNLDTLPREYIRERYEEALETRFKMANMRGQLEQIKSTVDLLEQHQRMLSQILASLQGLDSIGDTSGEPQSASLDIVGIIDAQEDERERLSRALHDGPAQSLTNFILQAEICQRLFDRNPDKAAEELVNLKTNASNTFRKVREFIFDLKPMMLDDLGLAPTVRRYVEAYGSKNEIETKAEIIGEDNRLEKYRETMIFRAVQDLMNMARDYGSSSQILVKLDLSGKVVRLVVEDNGNPFDASAVLDPEAESTEARVKGMRMLVNKFKLVSGKLEVRSTEQDGTIVRLELPAE